LVGGATVSFGQWSAIGMILLGITVIAVLSDQTSTQEHGKFWTVVSALTAAAAFSSTFYFGQTATEMTNGLVSAISTRIVTIGILTTGI